MEDDFGVGDNVDFRHLQNVSFNVGTFVGTFCLNIYVIFQLRLVRILLVVEEPIRSVLISDWLSH